MNGWDHVYLFFYTLVSRKKPACALCPIPIPALIEVLSFSSLFSIFSSSCASHPLCPHYMCITPLPGPPPWCRSHLPTVLVPLPRPASRWTPPLRASLDGYVTNCDVLLNNDVLLLDFVAPSTKRSFDSNGVHKTRKGTNNNWKRQIGVASEGLTQMRYSFPLCVGHFLGVSSLKKRVGNNIQRVVLTELVAFHWWGYLGGA